MGGHVLATDVADYLVGKGVPFREAHGVVARLSAHGSDAGKRLDELSLETYRRFSKRFDEDVLLIGVESSVAARDVRAAPRTPGWSRLPRMPEPS